MLEAERADDKAEVIHVVLGTAGSTRHADGVFAIDDRKDELHVLVGDAIALDAQDLEHADVRAGRRGCGGDPLHAALDEITNATGRLVDSSLVIVDGDAGRVSVELRDDDAGGATLPR